MTAPPAVWQRNGGSVDGHLSDSQAGALRALLIAEAAVQSGALAHHAAAMLDGSDTTGLGRAMHALHMYGARDTFEEIEDALARVDAGRFGTCAMCRQPIAFDYLTIIPLARSCAACVVDDATPRASSMRDLARDASAS